MAHRVTIVRVRRESPNNVNQELQWLGNSLGLFNLRDRDSSCFRVFITLVKRAKRNEVLSSDEIAHRLNLTRSTVVHHLTKLIDSGIVVREKGGYLLRGLSCLGDAGGSVLIILFYGNTSDFFELVWNRIISGGTRH